MQMKFIGTAVAALVAVGTIGCAQMGGSDSAAGASRANSDVATSASGGSVAPGYADSATIAAAQAPCAALVGDDREICLRQNGASAAERSVPPANLHNSWSSSALSGGSSSGTSGGANGTEGSSGANSK